MISSRTKTSWIALRASAILLATAGVVSDGWSHETGAQHLHFQKPGGSAQKAAAGNSTTRFRRPQDASDVQEDPISRKSGTPETAIKRKTVVSDSSPEQTTPNIQQVTTTAKPVAKQSDLPKEQKSTRVARQVSSAISGQVEYASSRKANVQKVGFQSENCIDGSCDECNEGYMCDAGCGMFVEAGCGCVEPGCGFAQLGCGIVDPGCGMIEPGCGCGEASCGVAGCGSCVGALEPDYFCFPVCLPRCKDLTFWSGVHGFRGPRDFAPDLMTNPRSDFNFGFHLGFNLSGRAPIVSLLFPQLSAQFGYQVAQSRLSGTVDTIKDRSQQFVTAGLFRRVNTGLQFGAVWDLLRDDLDLNTDVHQIRWEASLKSPQGRELGFWSAIHTNDTPILGLTYQTVDQYAFFYRWNFGKGCESRLWGGFTGDEEGIFGGEFIAPLNDRLSVQSGFNYLITDFKTSPQAVREESWNIGINLVWHRGCTARRGSHSPYRPLFAVADNGWMFVD